jgi:hypothetical protein
MNVKMSADFGHGVGARQIGPGHRFMSVPIAFSIVVKGKRDGSPMRFGNFPELFRLLGLPVLFHESIIPQQQLRSVPLGLRRLRRW